MMFVPSVGNGAVEVERIVSGDAPGPCPGTRKSRLGRTSPTWSTRSSRACMYSLLSENSLILKTAVQGFRLFLTASGPSATIVSRPNVEGAADREESEGLDDDPAG